VAKPPRRAPQRLRFLDTPSLERRPWGILCLVLNVVPGGVGTIVAGIRARHTGSIVVGIVQLLLVVALIGWIWSFAWGIAIYLRSR
jgi:hypothetical protein